MYDVKHFFGFDIKHFFDLNLSLAGASQVCASLLPRTLVISCNPATYGHLLGDQRDPGEQSKPGEHWEAVKQTEPGEQKEPGELRKPRDQRERIDQSNKRDNSLRIINKRNSKLCSESDTIVIWTWARFCIYLDL